MKKSILLLLGAVVATAFVLWSRQSPESASSSRPSASGGVVRAEPGVQPNELPPRAASLPAVPAQAGTVATSVDEPGKTDTSSLSQLPSSEQQSLWKAFAEARHEVREIPASWADRPENLGYDFYALNPKQGLYTRFGAGRVGIGASDRTYTEEDAKDPHTAWGLEMRLRSFAGRLVAGGASPRKAGDTGNRVEYEHSAGLIEWYVNRTEGIEHGYTIHQRPSHLETGAEVSLEVALDGLQAVEKTADDGTNHLVFHDTDNREVLAYNKLAVFDAEGRSLDARMVPVPGGLMIAYQDHNARYPVTVDPLITSQEAKITANDAEPFNYHGISVSVSGDTAVVGSYGDDDAGTNSGSAHVFVRGATGWTIQAKLTAGDAAAGDLFGISVSVSGDTALVGAYSDDDWGSASGSAYVFVRSGASWSQQAKLTASDGAALDLFGYSVSISEEVALVGAPENDDHGSESGSAYVFVRSGTSWNQQAKLTALDGWVSNYFGYSVSVSRDTAVIGAPFGGGKAYVFVRSGTDWIQQASLTAVDSSAFGVSASVSGNTTLIGANGTNSGTGSAYVFVRSGISWSQQAKLTASDAAAGDYFGNSVSLSGDTAVVGAAGDDDGGESSGSAYVFVRSGVAWSQQAKLTAIGAAAYDYFGGSVGVSGDTVLVGSHTKDDWGTDSGSAYVFRIADSGQRSMLVQDHLGVEIPTGGTASALPGQQTGTSASYTWRLSNMGTLGLDLQTISLGGADAGQFALMHPSISANPDLASGTGMDVTLTFSPSGSSGLRQAILIITSNDSDTPVYSANIQALALSTTTDTDGDGMNDWAEHLLRGNGFDWTAKQSNKVNDFYNFVSAAGLYTEDQIGGVLGNLGIRMDAGSGTVKLTIGLEQSNDLNTFTPHHANPAGVSVNGNGDIEYNLGVPAGKKFYRAAFKPAANP